MASPEVFTHLHIHTEYSSLDGITRPDEACRVAADDGQSAIAKTDHGTLAGSWAFRKAAMAAGIKPILGLEAYTALGSRFDNTAESVPDDEDLADADPDEAGKPGQAKTKIRRYGHLTILARTRQGWSNLVAMQNKAQESFFYKPRIDMPLLAEHASGLTVLTGCLNGPLASQIKRGNIEQARKNLHHLIEIMGADNVKVEIMDHGIGAELSVINPLLALAAETGLDVVATNDCHYTHAHQAKVHDAWLARSVKKLVADPDRFRFNGNGYHLKSTAEMYQVAASSGHEWDAAWQRACRNTELVAASVDDDVMPEYRLRLPKFDVPDDTTSQRFLVNLAVEGAKGRYGDPLPQLVRDRLNVEFKIINDKGLIDYFLIVWDVITWARSQGIRVGPGRGSSASSVLSYALGIVNVDPITNELLFERFLDPERVGMPDIDIDFNSAEGARVIAYLRERWGHDRVARIGTLGKELSRSAIKNMARVLGLSEIGNRMSKLVPIEQGQPQKIGKLLDPDNAGAAAFREFADTDDARAILDLAAQLEGVSGNEGIHACGVLISDEPMLGLVPLRKDRVKGGAGGWVTQWEAPELEEAGFLKLDILRLRTLRIVDECIRQIARNTGEIVDPDNPPTDPADPRAAKTWALLQAGRTAGVFQLEGAGIRGLTENIVPETLNDLTAIAALFRPGPLGEKMHERYYLRKNGSESVDYGIFTKIPAEQEAIAAVLGATYGIPVYQEQIMQLGTAVAGFDAIGRNRIRKAVSKKKKEEMAAIGDLFIAGAQQEIRADTGTVIKIAFAEATANKLWDAIKSASSYSFVKAHSAAYGLLGYITAYLKANWPAEFAAALLSVTDDADRRLMTLADLAMEDITVLGPSINNGDYLTAATSDGRVHLGTSEIKGVGTGAAAAVATARQDGPFTSLRDLFARVRLPAPTADKPDATKSLSVSDVEAMIEAGALDDLGHRMGLKMAARAAKASDPVVPEADWGALDQSRRERERTGVCLSKHPLVVLKKEILQWYFPVVDEEGNPAGDRPIGVHKLPSKDRSQTFVVGQLTRWTERSYSRGRMISFTLEGTRGSVDGVFFNTEVEDVKAMDLQPVIGDIVAIHGQVKFRTLVIETTNESGETVETEQERREITGQRLTIVPVPDAPVIAEPPLLRRVVLRLVGGPAPTAAPEKPDATAASDAATSTAVPVAPADHQLLRPLSAVPDQPEHLVVLVRSRKTVENAMPAKQWTSTKVIWPVMADAEFQAALRQAPAWSMSQPIPSANSSRIAHIITVDDDIDDEDLGMPAPVHWPVSSEQVAALVLSMRRIRATALHRLGDPILPLPGQIPLFTLPGVLAGAGDTHDTVDTLDTTQELDDAEPLAAQSPRLAS